MAKFFGMRHEPASAFGFRSGGSADPVSIRGRRLESGWKRTDEGFCARAILRARNFLLCPGRFRHRNVNQGMRPMTSSSTLRVEAALAQVRAGGSVLILDDESRENEGDIVVAAQFATPQAINFMARHGRGLICLALAPEQVERLGLPPMTAD